MAIGNFSKNQSEKLRNNNINNYNKNNLNKKENLYANSQWKNNE